MAKQQHPAFVRSEWIYDWKQSMGTRLGSYSALLLVAGLFVFLVLALRVRVPEPVEWSAPQASLMQLGQGDVGRLLAMKARAEGPFPSRFEPTEWEGGAPLRKQLGQIMEVEVQPHQPKLLPFPEPPIQPPSLARRGEPVLPMRSLDVEPVPSVDGVKLVPVMSAVDGIALQELPATLPDWKGLVNDRLAARSWKFLVEIEASGSVRDCVAIAGGGELGPIELSQWLRNCVFRTKPRDDGRRWVAVAVEFQNQKP